MTKLEVQMRDTAFGLKLVLVDQNGDVVPGQIETVLRCGLGELDQLTVTFHIRKGRVFGGAE